ncbi:sphingolipid long chain base-responsive protein [Apiospora arundinis]
MTKDDGRLVEFDSGVLVDKFCDHCGTGVVGEHRTGPLEGKFLVNVRAIQGVNPFRIESAVTTVHTEDPQQSFKPSSKAPPYTFSCHCGSIKATLLVPLQEQEVKEDNCSKCVRTGYVGVYPTKGEVTIPTGSWGNSFAYPGKYGGGPHHCKTCAVFVFHEVAGPPISAFDNLAPERRDHMLGIYHQNMNLQPLNVRCVERFDIGSLDIKRSDEGTEGARSDISLSPVLVTGGCGFIGFHIVSGLLERDPTCRIHVLDIDTSRNRVAGVEYHTADITSATDVETVFIAAKPTTVFHVACPDSMVPKPDVFRRVNVRGAHNLLASAQKTKTVRAFVNTSTSSVIHDNVSDLRDADETFPVLKYPQQKRVYTLTKAEAEADILTANRSNGDASMLTVSIRPASVFGERDTVTMGKIVANARAGKGKFQMGPGGNLFDFVYISNLVDAHILAAEALLKAFGHPPPPQDFRVDGECFHITNHERVPFWEFQRAIGASVGFPVKEEDVTIIPIWVAMLMATISEWTTWVRTWGRGQPIITREAVQLTTITRTLNGEKARRVLGYAPKVSMGEGLARAGKWFAQEAEIADDAKKTV